MAVICSGFSKYRCVFTSRFFSWHQHFSGFIKPQKIFMRKPNSKGRSNAVFFIPNHSRMEFVTTLCHLPFRFYQELVNAPHKHIVAVCCVFKENVLNKKAIIKRKSLIIKFFSLIWSAFSDVSFFLRSRWVCVNNFVLFVKFVHYSSSFGILGIGIQNLTGYSSSTHFPSLNCIVLMQFRQYQKS